MHYIEIGRFKKLYTNRQVNNRLILPMVVAILLCAVAVAGCEGEREPPHLGMYGIRMGPGLCSLGNMLTSCEAQEMTGLGITDKDSGQWVSFTIYPPITLHKGDILTIEPETATSCVNDDCVLMIYDERGHIRASAKK